mmetsp:Transcript_28642/g.56091  ORF Transcript_28642/g.56091 Transcript_28642/m.56091 type:complete len:450 (-) Transcript_28642:1259-2608(-)
MILREWIEQMYRIVLQEPSLPLATVERRRREMLFPPEMLTVRMYKPDHMPDIVRACRMRPLRKWQQKAETLDQILCSSTGAEMLQRWGVMIDREESLCTQRKVRVSLQGGEACKAGSKGAPLGGQKSLFQQWVLVTYPHHGRLAERLLGGLREECRRRGTAFQEPHRIALDLGHADDMSKRLCEDILLLPHRPQIILVVLPCTPPPNCSSDHPSRDTVYFYVKQTVQDSPRINCPVQCVRASKLSDDGKFRKLLPVLVNDLIAKQGGVLYAEAEINQRAEDFMTLVVGVDFRVDGGGPAVSFTATRSPAFTQYVFDSHVVKGDIGGIKSSFREFLVRILSFKGKGSLTGGKLPKRIVVFRGGLNVSESEKQLMLFREVVDVSDAIEEVHSSTAISKVQVALAVVTRGVKERFAVVKDGIAEGGGSRAWKGGELGGFDSFQWARLQKERF